MRRLLLFLALAAMVVTACGKDAPSPLATVTAAADDTAHAKTAHMTLITSIKSGGTSFATTVAGPVDFEHKRSDLTFSLPAAASAATGDLHMVLDDKVV